jgi:hypothetical protein
MERVLHSFYSYWDFSVLLILHTGKKNVVVEKIYAVFCNKLCAAHHRIIRFPLPMCFFYDLFRGVGIILLGAWWYLGDLDIINCLS